MYRLTYVINFHDVLIPFPYKQEIINLLISQHNHSLQTQNHIQLKEPNVPEIEIDYQEKEDFQGDLPDRESDFLLSVSPKSLQDIPENRKSHQSISK